MEAHRGQKWRSTGDSNGGAPEAVMEAHLRQAMEAHAPEAVIRRMEAHLRQQSGAPDGGAPEAVIGSDEDDGA